MNSSLYKYIRSARFQFPIIEDWINNTAVGALGWTSTTNTGGQTQGNRTEAGRQGIAALLTGGTNNNTGRAALSFNSSPMSFGDTEVRLEFAARMGNFSAAGSEIFSFIGFGDNINAGNTNTDGVYFIYDEVAFGNSNWQIVTSNNNVRTIIDTLVPVDLDWHTFKIDYTDNSSEVKFLIDNILVGTISTNIPTAPNRAFSPMAKISKQVTATTANKSMLLDWMILEILR